MKTFDVEVTFIWNTFIEVENDFEESNENFSKLITLEQQFWDYRMDENNIASTELYKDGESVYKE